MTEAIYKDKCRERNNKPAWYIRTGNVVTTSEVSKDWCERAHNRKMNALNDVAQINKQEAMTELFCFSY